MRYSYFISLGFVCLISCTSRPESAPTAGPDQIVIAEVNSTKITDKDLLGRIDQIEDQLPRNYSTHPQKKELLTQLMNLQLIYEEALKLGMDKDFLFKAKLAEVYIERLALNAKRSITPTEIQKYYEKHAGIIDQIGVRHILLRPKNKADSSERLALSKRIEEIRKEALKDPARFAELAQKYSEDGSASVGGELGLFSRSMMVKRFSDAAFKLKTVGEISPVVETEFGFHIIQLTNDRRGIKFYEEPIKERMVTEAQRDIFEKEVARLKKDKKFTIYEANLAKLSPLPKEVLTNPSELIPQNGIPQENKH